MSIWLGHTSLTVENCEDAWNESSHADITSTLNSSDYMVGSGSASLVAGANIATGNLLATEVVALDLSSYTHLCLWVKSSATQVAGALKFVMDEDASCASPSETLDLPALVANQWTACVLTFAAATSTRNAIISVGLKSGATIVSGTAILLDDLRALTARQFSPIIIHGLNRPDAVQHSRAMVQEQLDGNMYELTPQKRRRIITLTFNALTSEIDQYWIEDWLSKSEKRVIGTNDNVEVVNGSDGYTQDWMGGISIARAPVLKLIEKNGWTTKPVSWGYA